MTSFYKGHHHRIADNVQSEIKATFLRITLFSDTIAVTDLMHWTRVK